MGESDGAVDALAAEKEHLGQAHEGAAADHHRPLSCGRDAVAVEKTHDAQGGAADMAGQAAHQTTHTAFGETVDILFEGDQAEYRLGIQTGGKGELAENPVDRVIVGQYPDSVLHLCLRRAGRQVHLARHHAGLLGLAVLVADIDLARPVVADEHRGQAHEGIARFGDGGAQAGDDLVAESVAVHQHGTAGCEVEGKGAHHDKPTIWPSSSMSMMLAAGAAPRPGIVVMSPQIG